MSDDPHRRVLVLPKPFCGVQHHTLGATVLCHVGNSIVTSLSNLLCTQQIKMPRQRRSVKKTRAVTRTPRVSRFNEILKPMRVKMKYTDGVLLTTTTGIGVTTYAFRANSLFDPDQTGTGHQPYRFDQLAAIYQRYRVLKSKITVDWSVGDKTLAANDTGPWQVGVCPSTAFTAAGTGSDMYTLAESGGSQMAVLNNDTIRRTVAYWTPALTNLDPKDGLLYAQTNSNPANEYAFILWIWNQGQVAATNVIANVQIEFDCEFSRPLQTTAS